MTVQRESVFRCVFSSELSERVGHIRAWDAEEAVQLFRVELQSDGVQEHGTIRVEGSQGGEMEHRAHQS